MNKNVKDALTGFTLFTVASIFIGMNSEYCHTTKKDCKTINRPNFVDNSRFLKIFYSLKKDAEELRKNPVHGPDYAVERSGSI